MANDKELEITVDYNELLQRAVAVLERTRISIARSISDNISNAHWEIGRLLQEKKLDSKHGAGVVQRLSIDLKQRYPKWDCHLAVYGWWRSFIAGFVTHR